MRYFTLILFIVSTSLCAQTITRVEYYFDSDPGFGSGISIPVTAAADLTRNFSVPLNTVSEGFHLLYIRAKSNNGLWSLPLSRPVLVQRNAQVATLLSIDRVEYFFDTDPGAGNGIAIPITSTSNLTQDFSLPLGIVSEGFHNLYFRARSTNGLWSAPTLKPVFVQRNAQTAATPVLKQIEYFFDTDPGTGNATSISLSTAAVDQAYSIDLTTTPLGFHILYVRSQDVNGRWSLPLAKPFFNANSGTEIVALEYFYNDGATQTTPKTYTNFTPGANLTIDFAAALQGLLPSTSYEIRITAIDDENKRSKEAIHAFVTPAVICDPITSPSVINATLCGSGSVTFIASGATATQDYQWYTSATEPNAITGTSGNSFTTPTLTDTTAYFVSIRNGTCESPRAEVIATIISCNQPPEILFTEITSAAESVTEFNVAPLLSDPDGNLDATTLTITTPPVNANAFLTGTTLTLDYSASNFVGNETVELEVCDLLVSCTQQSLAIKVVGELEIYNALSPNNDLKNEIFYIRYIDQLPDTRENVVSIFNRWGALVFQISNYNNQDRVFTGRNNNGNELPTGTYFYKIEFENRPARAGYLTLKR